MLTRTVDKLFSERGASLSMALLLFLACTVSASIAIAAGSAAVGRVSQLEDMERSYYNVSSAASLFWDKLDGSNQVTIAYGFDATESDDSYEIASTPNYTLTVDDTEVALDGTTSLKTLFEAAAVDYAFNTVASSLSSPSVTISSSALKDFLSDPEDPTALGSGSESSYESFSVETDDERFSDVQVEVTRETDGSLTFCFYEDDPESFYMTMATKMSFEPQHPDYPSSNTSRFENEVLVTWTRDSLEVGGDES